MVGLGIISRRYKCDERLLNQARVANFDSNRTGVTIDLRCQIIVIWVAGLNLESRDLTDLVERSSQLSAKGDRLTAVDFEKEAESTATPLASVRWCSTTENRDTNHRSPTLQWRAKSPFSNQEVIHQQRQSCSPRPSLGRNINITDFQTLIATHAEENLNNVTTRRSPRPQGRARPTIPDQEATSQQRLNHSPRAGEEANLGMDVLPQPPGLPTLESVMEELNESTLLYMNVDDPVERAARQKRVLQTEIDGTVEETSARILRNSTANVLPAADLAPPHTTDSTPQASPLDTGTAKTARPSFPRDL
ncbi:unnamed protein product [Brassica oleracea]